MKNYETHSDLSGGDLDLVSNYHLIWLISSFVFIHFLDFFLFLFFLVHTLFCDITLSARCLCLPSPIIFKFFLPIYTHYLTWSLLLPLEAKTPGPKRFAFLTTSLIIC